jgi:hypothetical protein
MEAVMRVLKGMAIPIAITIGLSIFSWVLKDLPFVLSTWIRIFNGFVITALLIWFIRRVLSYEDRLTAHRTDILDFIRKGEAARKRDVEQLVAQTAEIAAEVAKEAASKAEALARLQATQSEKLDSIESTAKETLREQSDNLRSEVLAAVERGTAAAHAAQQEANHANKKIEELREDLVNKSKGGS